MQSVWQCYREIYSLFAKIYLNIIDSNHFLESVRERGMFQHTVTAKEAIAATLSLCDSVSLNADINWNRSINWEKAKWQSGKVLRKKNFNQTNEIIISHYVLFG